MVQSQQVLEWMAQGKAEGKAEALLDVLELKFAPIPPDLVTAIRATTDLALLKRWMATAVSSSSLTDFRQAAGV